MRPGEASKLTGRSSSIHMSLEDCIQIIGGRSIYRVEYRAAFDNETAKCTAVDLKFYADTGCASNDNQFLGILHDTGFNFLLYGNFVNHKL